jgi:hypothetical protein
MDCSNISLILPHPLVHVFAKLVNHLEWGRIVVVKSEGLRTPLKLLGAGVRPFSTQVIDLIKPSVFFPEELLHIPHRVPIDGLKPLTWKAHRDDPRSDVGEVKIEPILYVPPLVPRYKPLNHIISALVV